MTGLERKQFQKAPWTYFCEPFRIVGNLYFVGNKDVGSYLIKTSEGPILIDTGYPITVPLLFESLARIDVRATEIKHIIHTHGHFDHFGATDFLKAFSGGVTYLGRRDWLMFQNEPERSFVQDSHVDNFSVFEPDILLDGGETLVFGDTEIEVVATPGHSDGCMSFFFYQQENGENLRCGLFGGAGLNTLKKDYVKKYGNWHSRSEFIETLDKLSMEHVDVMLGNHTNQGAMLDKYCKSLETGNQSPFINKNDFASFIDFTRKRFERET